VEEQPPHLSHSRLICAQAALAGAVVAGGTLPAKLNTLVQPLMGALRREADQLLVAAAAEAVARLASLCVTRKPSPNAKVRCCCPYVWGVHPFKTAVLDFNSVQFKGWMSLPSIWKNLYVRTLSDKQQHVADMCHLSPVFPGGGVFSC
jgi:hypothetical protein